MKNDISHSDFLDGNIYSHQPSLATQEYVAHEKRCEKIGQIQDLLKQEQEGKLKVFFLILHCRSFSLSVWGLKTLM